eukprot:TRINITY_DN2799_c0_g1_i1.p1 TRINITY_DN2799_c0_g1~~TRINITY_DN2799_c0_g1_i1.p1  ORF type:complete len:226 (+),score=38.42 TRINITY_DN2799_c0_g1_i1:128-805(+)
MAKSYPPLFSKVVAKFAKDRPPLQVETIDLIRVKDDPVFLIHNLLTPDECQALIDAAEKEGFEDATKYCHHYDDRLNDRMMSDDPDLCYFLWNTAGLSKVIPTDWKYATRSGLVPTGINSRWRYCRYTEGHYFGPHLDGAFSPNNQEASCLTLMLYLNSTIDENSGGRTIFFDPKSDTRRVFAVDPKPGLAIVFPQDDGNYLHEGEKIHKGKKYILRSDIMFKLI